MLLSLLQAEFKYLTRLILGEYFTTGFIWIMLIPKVKHIIESQWVNIMFVYVVVWFVITFPMLM